MAACGCAAGDTLGAAKQPLPPAKSVAGTARGGIVDKIQVVIADDQTLFRESLARMLDAFDEIEVVATAADGQRATELARELMPDVLLVDLNMPKMSGIEATRRIRSEVPSTKVIVLTIYGTDEHVFRGLQAGACGYVLKDATPEELVGAIRRVAAGEVIISPPIAGQVLAMFSRLDGSRQDRGLHDGLTAKEIAILKMVATGKGSKEIARLLEISDKTVRNHISNIYHKLQVYDRTQIVLYAIKKGLVEVDEPASRRDLPVVGFSAELASETQSTHG
jgi:DNA-binding NarL/FixJ family response regulator